MSQPELDFQRRGAAGILLLTVPIASVIVVALGYAVLFWFGLAGRPATGPLVRVGFDGCPTARPLLEARVEAMGLPEATWSTEGDRVVLTARFPEDPRQLEQLPATLAARGALTIVEVDATGAPRGTPPIATEADLESALPYLAFLDTPRVRIQLGADASTRLRAWMEGHLEEGIAVRVDDRTIMTRRNLPAIAHGELDLDLDDASDRERLEFVASASIVLAHGPLPCALTPTPATPLDAR